MKKYKFNTRHIHKLADTLTPVSIYLKLRDKYPGTLLLESSDYHSRENSFSYICCQPVARFIVHGDTLSMEYPDNRTENIKGASGLNITEELYGFLSSFHTAPTDFHFVTNGFFGYMCYDAVQHFEEIHLQSERSPNKDIPEIQYAAYRFVIVIDHYKNDLYIFEHTLSDEPARSTGLNDLEAMIDTMAIPSYSFEMSGAEESNLTDEEYMFMVAKGREHCHRGDVFQIVLSREFSTTFLGDEFNVYRALRSVNPSPYLYFFDYGNFKIFGSSPEAQLTIRNGVARINPIAGTYRRTGIEEDDLVLAEQLKKDDKENSEHVMLVDLARNDLSRNAENVRVEQYRDIHFYSHVIHMVSQVAGDIRNGNPVQIAGDTFPAGTLSGAPKHMAMQLIDRYEPNTRSFYGGAIGFIGFNGDFNHAIIIRSFLSKNNRLTYQAGAGIVAASKEQNELQEVNNKIAALRKALTIAEGI